MSPSLNERSRQIDTTSQNPMNDPDFAQDTPSLDPPTFQLQASTPKPEESSEGETTQLATADGHAGAAAPPPEENSSDASLEDGTAPTPFQLKEETSPEKMEEKAPFQLQEAASADSASGLSAPEEKTPFTAATNSSEEKNSGQRPNKTGMSDQLKEGLEALSGFDMSDVRVHFNSGKPAELGAYAYAQGTEIHLGPGQEKYLPHEAWHIVQQKQGRVKPTMVMKDGTEVNDDAGLEREADVMGAKAMDTPKFSQPHPRNKGAEEQNKTSPQGLTTQLYLKILDEDLKFYNKDRNEIWEEVRHLVTKKRGRKKTLFQILVNSGDYFYRGFNDYQELADYLDFLCQKKIKPKNRKRPEFTSKITKKFFNQTWGGKRHRRHIIMSSVMRKAVYAITDDAKISDPWKKVTYALLIRESGFNLGGTPNLSELEYLLTYVLHNNPANLVLDSGKENSALGGIAHNFKKLLSKSDKELTKYWEEYQKSPKIFFEQMASGFEIKTQKDLLALAACWGKPSDLNGFRTLIELVFDNSAVDILTHVTLPGHVGDMLNLHVGFVSLEAKPSAKTFYSTVSNFINFGKKHNPRYSQIWD